MALTTNTSGAISKAAEKAVSSEVDTSKAMKAYITKMQGAIAKALPSVLTPERFTRITLSALSSTPKLAQTTPQSFLGAMMTAAQLGLEPNTPLGQAYLLSFKNKGVLECQFQIGYKGLIDLAYRSEQISLIQAHEVHENDEFTYEYGLEPKLYHKPALRDRGETYCYYAMFRTKDGGFGFEVMSREDIEEHARKYSQSYSSDFSLWKSNFDEMAKKTVLKKVLKYAPLKSDFVKAIAGDEAIKHDIAPDMSEVTPVDVDYVVDPDSGEVIQANTPEGGDGE